jgi:hypothetical protein
MAVALFNGLPLHLQYQMIHDLVEDPTETCEEKKLTLQWCAMLNVAVLCEVLSDLPWYQPHAQPASGVFKQSCTLLFYRLHYEVPLAVWEAFHQAWIAQGVTDVDGSYYAEFHVGCGAQCPQPCGWCR